MTPNAAKPERKHDIEPRKHFFLFSSRYGISPNFFFFFIHYEKNQKKKKGFCFSGKSDVTFIIHVQFKFSF